MGAVPDAPSPVGGEDAVDRLARGALAALAGLRGGKDKGRGCGAAVCVCDRWSGGVSGVLWHTGTFTKRTGLGRGLCGQ